METTKCNKCKIDKEKSKFLKNSKILANCQECRDKSKKWKKIILNKQKNTIKCPLILLATKKI